MRISLFTLVFMFISLACNKSFVPIEIAEDDFLKEKGSLQMPIDQVKEIQVYGSKLESVFDEMPYSRINFIAAKNAEVHSVANGTVENVLSVDNLKVLLIRTGNYWSAYIGLTEIYVCKGDKVFTRSPIGTIDLSANEGRLEFLVLDDKLNYIDNLEAWFTNKMKRYIHK